MPLYKIDNPFSMASSSMNQAAGTLGSMQRGSKTTTKGPGKTVGSGLMTGLAGLGTGAAMMSAGGASAAAAGALGGPFGIAALAIGAYLFS